MLAEHLVGRADELGSFERLLDELDRGHPGAVELAGEPGIGKTRLLRELAARAEARGHIVLSGAASEFEHDLPFSVFVDALDDYVAGLEPGRLAVLGDAVQAELAHVFPSLSALAAGREVALQSERYRSHRAVRELLKRLTAPAPLVLVLDDLHWADSASVELLGALLRRPPAAAVLVAVAVRPRQLPERLSAALERAHRAAELTRIGLGAFTPVEAREFLGETVDAAEATVLYQESGGNPFYLEQLARSLGRAGAVTPVSEISLTGTGVPPAVAAALSDELALLSQDTRLVLDGAAVAGDPFDPELAAAAAATSEAAAMDGVDELLQFNVVRSTDVPRRFGFRHPLVRHAVYQATPGGWRLGAHERCAEALATRGATAAARAHHVERSAREGDLGAVALLRQAGEEAARLAPASAARWFGAAGRKADRAAAGAGRQPRRAGSVRREPCRSPRLLRDRNQGRTGLAGTRHDRVRRHRAPARPPDRGARAPVRRAGRARGRRAGGGGRAGPLRRHQGRAPLPRRRPREPAGRPRLEAEWEAALQAAQDAEAELDRREAARPVRLCTGERAKILAIATDLPALWYAPSTTDRDRKELLHALLDDVVITVDAASRTARLVLHWKGGLISEISVDLPKPRPPYRTSEDTMSLIGRLAVHYDDSMIAKVLNQQQRRTATGMSFTPVNVASIRKRHGISPYQGGDVPDPDGEVMSVHQAAAELGITASTLYRWLNDGFVPGEQITPGAPWRIRLTGSIRELVADDAPACWVPVQVATAALGVSRQTVLQRVKRGELRAVHIRAGRRKGLRIELPACQEGLF